MSQVYINGSMTIVKTEYKDGSYDGFVTPTRFYNTDTRRNHEWFQTEFRYNSQGQLHTENDIPSVRTFTYTPDIPSPDGTTVTPGVQILELEQYHKNGVIHRSNNLPAYIYMEPMDPLSPIHYVTHKIWKVNGKYFRSNGCSHEIYRSVPLQSKFPTVLMYEGWRDESGELELENFLETTYSYKMKELQWKTVKHR